MKDQIQRFLQRIDEELALHAAEGERLDVYQLGRTVLVQHYAFPLTTTDFDIVRYDSRLQDKMIEKFGKGTPAARELGLYLDPVDNGLPPLPHGYEKRCREVSGNWQVLRVWALEIHDFAASKMKSFRPKDREDLQMMCDRGMLDAANLRNSLEAAYPFSVPGKDDDDDPGRVKAFRHLTIVMEYLAGNRRTI
jgi:hypothetical protein